VLVGGTGQHIDTTLSALECFISRQRLPLPFTSHSQPAVFSLYKMALLQNIFFVQDGSVAPSPLETLGTAIIGFDIRSMCPQIATSINSIRV
jgi:hypothetical protein